VTENLTSPSLCLFRSFVRMGEIKRQVFCWSRRRQHPEGASRLTPALHAACKQRAAPTAASLPAFHKLAASCFMSERISLTPPEARRWLWSQCWTRSATSTKCQPLQPSVRSSFEYVLVATMRGMYKSISLLHIFSVSRFVASARFSADKLAGGGGVKSTRCACFSLRPQAATAHAPNKNPIFV